MVLHYQKITIIKYNTSRSRNINERLQWLGNSLGLFNLRDKDKSCFRIFIELIKAAKQNRQMSSDELAQILNLSRGTIIHHMNKLIESGIVTVYKNRYILRVDNLESLIKELKRDADRMFDDLMDAAKEIDHVLGLKS